MHTRRFLPIALSAVVFALTVVSCERRADEKPSAPAESNAPGMTNRVDIPQAVRQNLGITFAKVESRRVVSTLRVPGRFELLPTAKREYRAQAGGRVELLVSQFGAIEVGTPLYRLDSPRWREMQKELAEAHAALKLAQAGAESIDPLLRAHEMHHTELQKAVELWTAQAASLEQLQAAGGVRGEDVALAKAALAAARSDLAETLEKEAELFAKQKETAAALDAARSKLAFLFEDAAALSGISAEELQAPEPSPDSSAPRARWEALRSIEVRALAPGVIESLHAVSGGVVDQHAPVLIAVQPEMVRFRAAGLQSDLPRLENGQAAGVVPAQTGAATSTEPALAGTLTIAPTADPERRTADLILTPAAGSAAPSWARAGVTAFLEIVTSGSEREELAIPLRCVTRGGTHPIIFRRDPADPDKAIRLEADLGIDDGRWVVIRSGVAEGNEIILEGVYQLMIATSGSITKGGHFHPDGTFHEGEH